MNGVGFLLCTSVFMDIAALQKQIPDSVLPYPRGLYKRLKYIFWKVIYPFHNLGRDVLLFFGIIHHEGRQDFLFGTLAPGRTVEGFLQHLEQHEFGNHFIAWEDDGEAISVRRLVDFEWQYHLRIYQDGEIRGHYEYTPESHPVWHLREVDMKECRTDFLSFFGDWVALA